MRYFFDIHYGDELYGRQMPRCWEWPLATPENSRLL